MDIQLNEEEYKKQIEFYEKMLQEGGQNENINYEMFEKFKDKNMKEEKKTKEKNEYENQSDKCSACESPSFIEGRKLKKKENPSLIDTNYTK